ncbi:MAG: terminase small subunit [Acetanaerobacterium sp.]
MAKAKKTLTEREELFCWHYASTQNAKEAVIKAGYGTMFAEKTAARLMRTDAVAARIHALSERDDKRGKSVRKGLERLAFGSIADAVALLCEEDVGALDIAALDLFCISEIKRPRGGGFEIKFFDRLKAMEKLAELDGQTADESAAPFYRAIERGAQAVQGKQEDGD